jgi:mannose-1-phosphate guanylyltransferase/mannose-6-phosphate isomerase
MSHESRTREPASGTAIPDRVHLVLAGGAGVRLWPVSREHAPKQTTRGFGPESMLQRTVRRLAAAAGDQGGCGLVIVAPQGNETEIRDQLAQMGAENADLVLEPVRRNTAPALTMAALHAVRRWEDTVLVVTPADHQVDDDAAYAVAVEQACRLACLDRVVAIGAPANSAHTGYGYIELGDRLDGSDVFELCGFREKPDLATALAYVAGGRHLWNTGILVLKASLWLALIRKYEPAVYDACVASFQASPPAGKLLRPEAKAFAACPSISIDHAVMERLPDGRRGAALTIALRAGWSDVGSWDAMWAIAQKDPDGNATRGSVAVEDVSGSIVYASHRRVACLGLRDLVVVETADAVLVAPRSAAQNIGSLVRRLTGESAALPVAAGDSCAGAVRVARPWGYFEVLQSAPQFCTKRLVVDPGASLSLQRHAYRSEHWIVVVGQALAVVGDQTLRLQANGSVFIPLGVAHRLTNTGSGLLQVVEVQTGAYLAEDDILRLEDAYGRADVELKAV